MLVTFQSTLLDLHVQYTYKIKNQVIIKQMIKNTIKKDKRSLIHEDARYLKVAQLVESGQYYNYGFDWYFDLCLSFFWQKKLFFLLAFILIIILGLMLLINKDQIPPKKILYPFSSYSDSATELISIKKLEMQGTKDSNILISNYLIEKYVSIRESYDYKSLDYQDSFLFNNSSSEVYFEYKKNIDSNNLDSSILKYHDNNSIEAKVTKITIKLNENYIPTQAIVNFERINIESDTSEGQYYSIIDFLTDDISLISNASNGKINFKIIDYKVYKL